ncbi:MAG: putative transposase [Archaeoglobi archaeon]|nr:putative transposase [Archaeoglobi archaeon]
MKKWVKKLEEGTVVKANRKHYCVYAAIDVEKNELILMRVYATRNRLTTKSFIKEVLSYFENKPKFVVDKASWR